MYTQYEKKDISTVTLKNKLATSIMYSSIELTKTQVLLQNTALLVEGSLHFSLSLCKLLDYLNYAQTFVCGKKIWKVISYFKAVQEVI